MRVLLALPWAGQKGQHVTVTRTVLCCTRSHKLCRRSLIPRFTCSNLIARVPAGRSFSIACPDSDTPAVVECSGAGVEVVDGVCVPIAAYATADSVTALVGNLDALSARVDVTVASIQNMSAQMTLMQTQSSGGPPNVLVVAIQVTENCTFGDCLVTVVTKPSECRALTVLCVCRSVGYRRVVYPYQQLYSSLSESESVRIRIRIYVP